MIAGEELAAEPVPRNTVRTAERQEPFDPMPYAVSLLFVAIALGAGLIGCSTTSFAKINL